MRHLIRFAVVVMAVLLLAPATGTAQRVERPTGKYTTGDERFLVIVQGRAIEIAAFDFGCRDTTARTSVNDIAIRKVDGRWRFSERVRGIVTYDDDHPDENAKIRLTGAFTANARRVTGRLRVSSEHCGTTKLIAWSAAKQQRAAAD